MPLEQEIVQDLMALNEKIKRHLRTRSKLLKEDALLRRQLEPLLEDFRKNSIILLPPEGSACTTCPTCGRRL